MKETKMNEKKILSKVFEYALAMAVFGAVSGIISYTTSFLPETPDMAVLAIAIQCVVQVACFIAYCAFAAFVGEGVKKAQSEEVSSESSSAVNS